MRAAAPNKLPADGRRPGGAAAGGAALTMMAVLAIITSRMKLSKTLWLQRSYALRRSRLDAGKPRKKSSTLEGVSLSAFGAAAPSSASRGATFTSDMASEGLGGRAGAGGDLGELVGADCLVPCERGRVKRRGLGGGLEGWFRGWFCFCLRFMNSTVMVCQTGNPSDIARNSVRAFRMGRFCGRKMAAGARGGGWAME